MKRVAIAGFGSEGLSAYKYFSAKGYDVTIFDQKKQPNQPVPEGAKFVWGNHHLDKLQDFDMVVRFPAIRPDRIKTKGKVTSVTKEFFESCPALIIGVTGSKGKGTTASLIHAILQAGGIKSHLVGNIGVPALDVLPNTAHDDVVVFELSSFQLWDLTQSPHIAVVLMIEPEHLDVHKDIDEYVDAKANIRRHQGENDVCYYHPTNNYARLIALQSEWQDRAFRYAVDDHGAVYAKNGKFYTGDKAICPVNALQIIGEHNIENACAAISAARHFVRDNQAIEAGLRSFTGLPHRLKLVKEVEKIKYYDDSIATTPGAVIAALKALKEPKILIAGGSDKGADFDELAHEITQNNVKYIVLIGQSREKIQKALIHAGFTNVELLDEKTTMPQIVARVRARAEPGDAVVLAPACASFDMFKNYADRGDQFIEAVQRLAF